MIFMLLLVSVLALLLLLTSLVSLRVRRKVVFIVATDII
jgi:hypothetical protein